MLRFDAEGLGEVGGTVWTANQLAGLDLQPNLLDLDGDGRRRLVVALYCGASDPQAGQG